MANRRLYRWEGEGLDAQTGEVAARTVRLWMRETEGGGHAHLFTRDVLRAITETRAELHNAVICLVIIARNWSLREVEGMRNLIDSVFYFDANPSAFAGFDDSAQIRMNLFIQELLDGAI